MNRNVESTVIILKASMNNRLWVDKIIVQKAKILNGKEKLSQY